MFAKIVSELMQEIFFSPNGFYSRLDNLLTLQVPAQPPPVPNVPPRPALGFGQSSASFDSMKEVDDPEQPDEDDGLTPSEFPLLAQQARDPGLKPRERSNAAAMLIGGLRGFASPPTIERL
ncbi:hypothetical protein M413DRAFT_448648, partial [Hebeloma cylindrosporum]